MLKFIFDSDTWQEIFEGIRKNKLRTAITVFGVMWGVFLLVGLLGFARGVKNGFNKQIGGFATNSVFIWTQPTGKAFKGYQKGRNFQMELQDVAAIENHVKGIDFVVPRNLTNAQITRRFKSLSEGVFGDYPRLDVVQKVHLVYGRFINQKDIENRRKVCVIKESLYKQLFDKEEYPIGAYLKINDINFMVVGMYKESKVGGPGGALHIPFTTFQQIYNRGTKIGWVMITGKPEYDISQIESDTKLLLKTIHKVHPEDPRAFGSANVGEMFKKVTGFLSGMQFLTWFVGIATLIAGVFAIGNILLITVKERTQEIGIRRALGATPKEIKRQIVLESVFLTGLAGALGIIIGGAVLYYIDHSPIVRGENAFISNPTVDIPVILIAVLILIILGTLIGLIPAHIATSIKPIDALRDE